MTPFQARVQARNITLLPHAFLGHWLAGILSALGLPMMAEEVHYRTLPARVKRRLPVDKVYFSHDRGLMFHDFITGPLIAVARALGSVRLEELAKKYEPKVSRDASLRYAACGSLSLIDCLREDRERGITPADVRPYQEPTGPGTDAYELNRARVLEERRRQLAEANELCRRQQISAGERKTRLDEEAYWFVIAVLGLVFLVGIGSLGAY